MTVSEQTDARGALKVADQRKGPSMNGRWVDRVARAVATETSRRRVLRTTLGGLIGGVAGGLGAPTVLAAERYGAPCQQDAECATGFCFRSPNGNNRCLCPNPRQQPCGGLNGRCCDEGEVCADGRCRCARGGMCGSQFLACGNAGTPCVCSATVGGAVCAEFFTSFCVAQCADCPAGTVCSTTTCCSSGAACVVRCGSAAPSAAAKTTADHPFPRSQTA